MLKPEDYTGSPNGRQGRKYEPPDRRGYTVINVLNFLKGRPWDDVALAYVHALRPSHIRVVIDGTQLDSQPWRVTVYLDDNKIRAIHQEVEVGLPDGCKNGGGLNELLQQGGVGV